MRKRVSKRIFVGANLGHLLLLEKVVLEGKDVWKCTCACEKKVMVLETALMNGSVKSCGCKRTKPAHNFIDITGRKFGHLTVIKRIGLRRKGTKALWVCECDCGKRIERSYGDLARGENGGTRSCGCLQSNRARETGWRGVGELGNGYLRELRRGAVARNLCFELNTEQLWRLFLAQGRKCVLTGLEISFGSTSKRRGIAKKTASLDRIDSTKGYTFDNVQWVHKTIQHMKNKYPQNMYIELCRLVSENSSKNMVEETTWIGASTG